MEKASCFSGVTAAQEPQPCASPSIPEHDAGTREGGSACKSPGVRAELPGRQEPSAPRPRGTAPAGGAEPAAAGPGGGSFLRGPAGTEGGSRGVGRRRGKAAGRHGTRAAIKGPGAAEPRISLARSHSGRSSTSIAAGQHQMGMGTALAARLGLGLLLLALLLPTQVSPGAARRFPSAGPRARPSGRGSRGAGSSREELPLVCAVPEPAAAPRGWPWVPAAPPPRDGGREERGKRGTSPGSPGCGGRGWARTGGEASPQPWDGGAVDYPGQIK